MTRHLERVLLACADRGCHSRLCLLQGTHIHSSGIGRQAVQQALSPACSVSMPYTVRGAS